MGQPLSAKLYNGTVDLTRGANHVYRARIEGGKSYPLKNVTSIIGVKDKSRALMPWQAKVISFIVGERVQKLVDMLPEPGVKFALTDKAYAGLTGGLSALKRACLTATDEIRDRAGDEGTLLHAYIEAYFNARAKGLKKPPSMKGLTAPAKRALVLFGQWVVEHNVSCLSSERVVFSKKHFVAGQLDLILEVDGVVGPWDIKTGKGVYGEVLLQTAAYKLLWNEEAEETDDMAELTGDGGVLLFMREDLDPVTKLMTGDFEVVHVPLEEADTEAFLALLTVSRWDSKAWKRINKARGL